MTINRRDWILGSIAPALWPAIAGAQDHARRAAVEGGSFVFFDPATAADVAAIAREILPSDDGPGSTEAGVVYFIDRALHTFDSDKQDGYRKGISAVNEVRRKLFPASESIAKLESAQAIKLLQAIDKTEFFEVVRVHTLLGFLGNPSYGGNRGGVGWRHIGFDDRMMWEPPFGYYDRKAQ